MPRFGGRLLDRKILRRHPRLPNRGGIRRHIGGIE
jgi:hypothetical protein